MKYPHPWRRLGALACTAALTLTLIPAASASGGGYRQSGSLDMDKPYMRGIFLYADKTATLFM